MLNLQNMQRIRWILQPIKKRMDLDFPTITKVQPNDSSDSSGTFARDPNRVQPTSNVKKWPASFQAPISDLERRILLAYLSGSSKFLRSQNVPLASVENSMLLTTSKSALDATMIFETRIMWKNTHLVYLAYQSLASLRSWINFDGKGQEFNHNNKIRNYQLVDTKLPCEEACPTTCLCTYIQEQTAASTCARGLFGWIISRWLLMIFHKPMKWPLATSQPPVIGQIITII